MAKKSLYEHVFSTYITLRLGMITFAAILPIAVWLWGLVFGIPLQPSISDYYWATYDQPPLADWSIFDQYAPSRVWFVGALFALAACLYLYKGFSAGENFALNLAAAFTIGVAIFPMCYRESCGSFSVHGFCAIAAFACLFYVMWFRSGDTLQLVAVDQRPRYRRTYRLLGLAVFGLPVAAFFLNAFFGARSYIFFIEWSALLLFAAYWWVKTRELKTTEATKKVLAGEVTALQAA